MKKAVFAGSFDPITLGHLDILEQALERFDEIVVVLGVNPDKKGYFSYEDRLAMIQEATKEYPRVGCAYNQGMTVDFARSVGARYLIRGLRGDGDREYEAKMAEFNRRLAPEIETVFFSPRGKAGQISSTLVRQRLKEGAEISNLVAPGVADYIAKKKA